MSRRAAREKALQGVFQVDIGKTDIDEAYSHVLGKGLADETFFKELFYGTMNHLEDIDQMITAHLENWKLERLANVDRNLLRIAVYEMKYMDVPNTVTINEAIEIAKLYGDDQSSRFINGVLSKVKEDLDQNS